MDYATLKVSSLVNRAFKAYYESPELDKILFRRVLPISASRGLRDTEIKSIKFHPAFDWISCNCDDDFEDIKFASPKEGTDKIWKLDTTSAALEYATMPALERLDLQIVDFAPFPVTNETGVTVTDVFAAIWENIFAYPAFSYGGDLMPVTGEANGMTDLDWADGEPDGLSFARGFLPGSPWHGFASWWEVSDDGVLCVEWYPVDDDVDQEVLENFMTFLTMNEQMGHELPDVD